jgi:F-type H+-transporting ATPase subunit delta
LKSGSLARRYAKALIAIGIDDNSYEQLGRELLSFAELLEGHRGLATTLQNPSYALSKRRAVLDALLKKLSPSKTILNFLQLALDRDRIGYVPDIARAYETMADEHAGRVRAEVVAAQQGDLQQLEQLKKALEARTGKQVVLTTRVDPELIAGKVTRIGSIVFDGSVRTRLDQLGTDLLQNKV